MKVEELKVTSGNILVKPILEEEKVGNLIVAKTYEDKAYCGDVVISGDEEISKGMKVFFNKYSSIEFSFEGEKYLMLKSEDILAYA